jgi:hypothetical protein
MPLMNGVEFLQHLRQTRDEADSSRRPDHHPRRAGPCSIFNLGVGRLHDQTVDYPQFVEVIRASISTDPERTSLKELSDKSGGS